ncbi:chemotaxis protein CheR [Trichlorobacter lovleyi]|uniref:class I SAM-dependent methyltransferase n=1 Tax=Trichlorobacter lovleyi TaxID=313985 RepID=UPI00223F98AB|nr:CheR family methyltransferase [Trichlorobacter lovleyi]QOX77855.1 chemotaxis protein CheR [Trichlorobacter lovleyi]
MARNNTFLQQLHRLFAVYAATSPQPLPAPGLIITPEIRLQSELYLPIATIRRVFYRLYGQALVYPPICSSTPFHTALSWADCYAALPSWLQRSPNPARLLEHLLQDHDLLTGFIFHSFLPSRFNGAGFGRYPDQLSWLRQNMSKSSGSLRVLDAACGSGEGTWELAELLAAHGWPPEQVRLEGWTLEPLEVWAAENRALPHDLQREQSYRQRIQPLKQQGWDRRISFQTVDLLAQVPSNQAFDLILCNGLLGGPIISNHGEIGQVLGQLVAVLNRGGMLLIADHFHAGWRKKVPLEWLCGLLCNMGLEVRQAGEGLVAIKPCT